MEQPDAGFALLQKLRLTPACAGIPVIMVAANDKFLRENEERLRALNCDALAKPFDIEALLRVISARIGSPPSPQESTDL